MIDAFYLGDASDATRMAYAARLPGKNGYCAITLDKAGFEKDTAKDVAKWIRAGATVEHVYIDDAIDGMLKYLADKRTKK